MERENPWVALQLAAVYETLGDQRAACREVETFLEHPLGQKDPQLRNQLLRSLVLKYQVLEDLDGVEHAAKRLLQGSQEPQDEILARSALARVFRQRGQWTALEEQARALLPLAEALDDQTTQVLARTDLACVAERQGAVEEAMAHARKLIELVQDPGMKAIWTMLLGGYQERLGAFKEARNVYEELLDAPWFPRTHALRGLVQIALAWVLAQTGEVPGALTLVERVDVQSLPPPLRATAHAASCVVYRLGGRLHSVSKEVDALWRLAQEHPREASLQLLARMEQARFHLDRGENKAAMRAAEEALEWAVRADSRDSEIDCTLLLADLCQIQGDLSRAERCLKDTEALIHQGRYEFKRIGLYHSWGCLASRSGHYREARARFEEALQLAQGMGAKAAQCGTHILHIAFVDLPCQDWSGMAERLDQGMILALTCEFRVHEAILTGLWGIWQLEAAGDRNKAYRYLSDAQQLMDEIGFYGPLRALVEEILQGLEGRR